MKNRSSDLNSLLCVLNALSGSQITIQLRNETEIYGTIATIDGHMNIELSDAVLTDIGGTNKDKYDLILIHSRNIRYIQIPDRIDLNHLLYLYSKTLSDMQKKYQRTKRKPDLVRPEKVNYVHDDGSTVIVTDKREYSK
ncbi:hypothetical protein SAMD00019534_050340, partial [Acytostelium subglobosum LB1]|uniref:hypothetical protein n=1 Tax=Acytostelium subglobosum LB1 TaxID=1410327 RepID=UPI00064508FB